MRYTLHEDGGFDLTGERLCLRNCYPAITARRCAPSASAFRNGKSSTICLVGV